MQYLIHSNTDRRPTHCCKSSLLSKRPLLQLKTRMYQSILLVTVTVLLSGGRLMSTAAHSIIRADEDSSVDESSTSTSVIIEFEDDASHFTTLQPTKWEQSGSKRFERALGSRSSENHHQCPVLSYHPGSEIGHQASCPFDWVVDMDPNRIPEKLIEQVCRRCRSCGPHRGCIQLRLRYDVYYRDTSETSRLEVRAGCVCMPQSVGSTASPLDI